MKKFYSLTVALVTGTIMCLAQNIGINTVSLSKDTATACDVVIFSITGTHGCTTTSLGGISHSLSRSNITISVQADDPFICQGALTSFNTTYSLPLTGITANAYTVTITYTATNPGSSAVTSLVVLATTPADAGIDTTYCHATSHNLTGNTLPIGITGTWSVLSGSGTITNPNQPQTTVTGLGYGTNEFEWAVMDPNCTIRDTVKITNFEMPSAAITESDFIACSDTATIDATPPTAGTGTWSVLNGSVFLLMPNSPSTPVIFSGAGHHAFEWKIENGICQASIDTLEVEVKLLTDTPQISFQSGVLSSTPAPAYQWHLDGQAIPGATSQNHTPTTNGIYDVLTTETGCSTGLFSNEIELSTVGINQYRSFDLSIYPNPAQSELNIRHSFTDPDLYIEIKSFAWSNNEISAISESIFNHRIGIRNLCSSHIEEQSRIG